MDARPSYYEILKISSKTSDEDVKRAYHTLAKKFHPDCNPQSRQIAELRFRLINEAYAALKTHERRAKYNRSLRLNAQNDNSTAPGFLSQIGEIFWPQKNTNRTKEKTT